MRFDGMCKCIDENWNALKARIQASITGIKLNGTTYYQTDGTGICDLGTIETEPPTASDVKMADGTTVQDAITTNKTDISTLNGEIDACLNNVGSVAVDNGLNINRTYIDGTESQAMFMTVDPDTITIDGKQIRVNDDVIANITNAQGTADVANGTATIALSYATDALSMAGNAIIQLSTEVVDTTLEMIIDKDESTATIPLFTAGTNLSWDGTTLSGTVPVVTKSVSYSSIADAFGDLENGVYMMFVVIGPNIMLNANYKQAEIVTTAYGYKLTADENSAKRLYLNSHGIAIFRKTTDSVYGVYTGGGHSQQTCTVTLTVESETQTATAYAIIDFDCNAITITELASGSTSFGGSISSTDALYYEGLATKPHVVIANAYGSQTFTGDIIRIA